MSHLLLTMGGTIDAAPYPDGGTPPGNITPTSDARACAAMRDIISDVVCIPICNKDSKDLNATDMNALANAITSAHGYDRIIVTMGTDCLPDVARAIKARAQHLICPVVFTGAFVPLANGMKSDGIDNLRKAALDHPDLVPGIYIAAGNLFTIPDRVYKDFDRRVFAEHTHDPVFQSIFGQAWNRLPPVMLKHYANRPFSNDVVIAEGVLDVMARAPMTWFGPFFRLVGNLPAQNENAVPVTVRFESDRHSNAVTFRRRLSFRTAKPYEFASRMTPVTDNVVIENMPFGLGWKAAYDWDGSKVVITHRGYTLRVFGRYIPMPLTLIMGAGYAEETPVDDDHFDMIMHITHKWWGKVYQYKGRFRIGSAK